MKQKKQPKLSESVLNTIEEYDVCPRSRWFFVCKETLVWILWGLTVAVGAIAVAVALFVVTHSQYALFEAAYDSFWLHFFNALPYVWLVLFGLMVFLATKNLRHTKRGYRYTISKVVLSSLLVSLAGGAVLQLFGFGYVIDMKLGKEMDMYMSQDKKERQLWQAPYDGRLIGKQVLTTTIPTTTVIFEDSNGQRWRLDVTELTPMDVALLRTQETVRLVGTSSDLITKQFHACGAFPWLLNRPMSLEELSAERQAFVERVYKHKDMAEERLVALESEVFESDSERLRELMGPCAQIAPVRRIGDNMR